MVEGRKGAHIVALGGLIRSSIRWPICKGKRPPTEAAYLNIKTARRNAPAIAIAAKATRARIDLSIPLNFGWGNLFRPKWRRPLLSDDAAALFANEHIVSVDLTGKSRPATREIFQSLGFSLTLR
jgi:hypothetical protein